MEPLFKVRFTGQLSFDAEKEAVIVAFSDRFSIAENRVRQLLDSGSAVTLKKGLTREKAERYQRVVEGLGMEVAVIPMSATVGQSPAMANDQSGVDSGSVEQPLPSFGGLSLEPIDGEQSAQEAPVMSAGPASPSPRSVTCPKCGSERVEEGSCLECGIVIAKYLSMQDRLSTDYAPTPAEATGSNPYAVPSANLIPEADEGDFSGPAALPMGAGWQWFTRGFWHFRQNPFAWIGVLLLWMIVSVALSAIPVIGVIGSLVLSLLSPVILAGFVLGAHTQEQGGDFTIAHLLAGFSSNVKQLVLVGLLYLGGIFIAVVLLGLVIGGLFFTGGDMSNPQMGSSTIVLAVLAGTTVTIPLVMAYWFAPALIVFEGMSAIAAMKLSFNGCVKNILPFLFYGIVATFFLILGALPLGLGLLVVFPVVTASIYTSYRAIYYS